MKIWLDDIRDPKDWRVDHDEFAWIKDPDEAIKLIETGYVTYISFDHDLGEPPLKSIIPYKSKYFNLVLY